MFDMVQFKRCTSSNFLFYQYLCYWFALLNTYNLPAPDLFLQTLLLHFLTSKLMLSLYSVLILLSYVSPINHMLQFSFNFGKDYPIICKTTLPKKRMFFYLRCPTSGRSYCLYQICYWYLLSFESKEKRIWLPLLQLWCFII